MTDRNKTLEHLIEAARLLGITQAKKGYGVYTIDDGKVEGALHESIDKYKVALAQPEQEPTQFCLETGEFKYPPINPNLIIGQLTVTNGRLKKKIIKLQKQRDHFKEQNVLTNSMLSLYPYIKRDYESYKKAEAAQNRLKELESRVKEQDLLIRILSEQKYAKHEVEKAYADIIKKAYKEMINETT